MIQTFVLQHKGAQFELEWRTKQQTDSDVFFFKPPSAAAGRLLAPETAPPLR